MPHPSSRSDAIQRLVTAHGHLAAVRDMARSGAPCGHLIFQLRAVRGALQQVEQALIEEHIRHCVGPAAHLAPDTIDEILELWSYSPIPKQRARTHHPSPSQPATPENP